MSIDRDYFNRKAIWQPLTVMVMLFVLTTAAFVLLMIK